MLREHIIFNVSEVEVEVHEMNKFFEQKLYCEMNDLYRQFLLALRFLARKSEIEKKF